MGTLPRLMLVTDRRRTRGRDLVSLVTRAVEGGVEFVQVSERDLPERELEVLVRNLRRAASPGVRIVVDGNSRVARHAHGLHLSATDLPLPAHRWEEDDWLVGRSAGDEAEVRAAVREGVSYIVFEVVSSPDHGVSRPAYDRSAVGRIVRLAHPTPVFAKGEITISRIPEVIHAGAWGVAVTGAILEATHPRGVVEAMMAALRVASGG